MWYVASLDPINLPKILLSRSTKFYYHSTLNLQGLRHYGQTGAQHLSASPGPLHWALRPPVPLGHPQRLSHHPHPAWSVTTAAGKVRRTGGENHVRICIPGPSADLTGPTSQTTLREGSRSWRFPAQFEREAEGMSKGSWKSRLHLTNFLCPSCKPTEGN